MDEELKKTDTDVCDDCDCECEACESCEANNNIEQSKTDALEREIEELEAKLSSAIADKEREFGRANDVNTMYLRLQADFDNYRKRTADQLSKTKEDGIAEAMTKVIPTLDVIGRALSMITDEKVAEGVQMIERQLLGVLTEFGVSEIPSLGKEFDPELHNAILQVKADKPDTEGRVIEVFQKGYSMGDRILRHSVVKVAR